MALRCSHHHVAEKGAGVRHIRGTGVAGGLVERRGREITISHGEFSPYEMGG